MESWTGIDTPAECQAVFRRNSVSEREAGRLLLAGRKLAAELDRRDAQLAEALEQLSRIRTGTALTEQHRAGLARILTRHR